MDTVEKQEREQVYFKYVMDIATRPTAVLNLDGTIVKFNHLFEKEFLKPATIQEIMDGALLDNWGDLVAQSQHAGYSTFTIENPDNVSEPITSHFMYSAAYHKIFANFKIPPFRKKEIELTYLNAFRRSNRTLFIVDQDGIICDIEGQFDDFFSMNREQFIGRKAVDLVKLFPDWVDEFFEYLKTVDQAGYAKALKPIKISEDTVKYFAFTTFLDEETQMYLTCINDETEKMQLEEQLDHSNSLSSVGQLAASIAHEIKNPMTTLKGFTQLLKKSATQESLRYLSVIDDEINRMELILSEMLALAKPGANVKQLTSLQDVLTDVIRIIYPKALLEQINIVRLDQVPFDELLYLDIDKIKQVLLNLLKNSLESMNSGGTLTVGIEKTNDNRIVLTIADTGKGMNDAQLKQVFMPFFTTKIGGTGLGLPFVLKIIEDHKGEITVESEVGKGSTFTLSFPIPISQTEQIETNEEILS